MTIRPTAKKIIDITPIGYELGFLQNNVGNFSMLPMNGGEYWLASFRVFQYWIDGEIQEYWKSKNLEEPDYHHFCVLDKDFNFVKEVSNYVSTYYRDPIFNEERPYLEDGRLTLWNGKMYITSAIFYQHNNHYERFGTEIQQLSFLSDGIQADHLWSSCESGLKGTQKNWMAVPDKPFTFITGTYEGGASLYNVKTNNGWTVGCYDEKDELYRGNTPLLRFDDDRYFTITHRLVPDEKGRKKYLNYFVLYDNDLLPIRFSKPFKMTDYNIEFITYMSEREGELLIGTTIMDDTPELHIYDKRELLELVDLVVE